MKIEQYSKISRILLLIGFFAPLLGFIPELYYSYFVFSPNPQLVGVGFLVMGLSNLLLILPAGIIYMTGTIFEVKSRIKQAVIFYILCCIVSISSIISMLVWCVLGFTGLIL